MITVYIQAHQFACFLGVKEALLMSGEVYTQQVIIYLFFSQMFLVHQPNTHWIIANSFCNHHPDNNTQSLESKDIQLK